MKLREAEANLSLKEMKARVQDLEETWDRHQEKQREWESNGRVSGELEWQLRRMTREVNEKYGNRERERIPDDGK